MTNTTSVRPTCIEGGTRHAWQSTGLDVQPDRHGKDRLVRTKACYLCGAHYTYPYAKRGV